MVEVLMESAARHYQLVQLQFQLFGGHRQSWRSLRRLDARHTHYWTR